MFEWPMCRTTMALLRGTNWPPTVTPTPSPGGGGSGIVGGGAPSGGGGPASDGVWGGAAASGTTGDPPVPPIEPVGGGTGVATGSRSISWTPQPAIRARARATGAGPANFIAPARDYLPVGPRIRAQDAQIF